MRTRRKLKQTGSAMVEFGLIFPLFLLIVIFAVDFGIYVLAFVSVENAARAAALRNSSGRDSATDRSAACRIVKDALLGLPGMGHASADCAATPVTVTALYCDGTSPCPGLPSTPDGGPASVVTVQYQVPALFRFPFSGPSLIARTAQMRMGGLQ